MSYQVADYRSRTIGLEQSALVPSIYTEKPSAFDVVMIIVLLLLVAAFVILLLVLVFRKPSGGSNGGGLEFTSLKITDVDSLSGVYRITWAAPKATKVSISPTTYLVNPTGANNLPASGFVELSGVKPGTGPYTVTATDANGNTKSETVRIVVTK